jgi:hypothetical protein
MYFMLVLKVMFFNQYVVGFQVFSVRTRGRAVTIFNTCSTMIANMAELQKVWVERKISKISQRINIIIGMLF